MAEIIRKGRIENDVWTLVAPAAEASPATVDLPAGPLLLPLALWQARRQELQARREPQGVWLSPADDPQAIADSLDRLALVAIHFPKFADGRGYSSARLLRERYGYRGELRAFGDVGRDQVFFLARVGFDSFVLGEGKSAREALAALSEVPVAYQGAVDDPRPLFRRRTRPS